MKLFSFSEKFPQLVSILSTREDGPMPTSRQLATSPLISNRVNFLERNLIVPNRLVTGRLSHGINIQSVEENQGGLILEDTDGLMTNVPELFLSVTVADCIPIYFFDSQKNAIAIAHAGWRGLAANMPKVMVEHLQKSYYSTPADILVGLGPAIGPCHYEVGQEIPGKFHAYPDAVEKRHGKFFLDLQKVCQQQLLTAGVLADNIEIDQRCTFEDESLYFFRRSGDISTGVMTAVIGLTKKLIR